MARGRPARWALFALFLLGVSEGSARLAVRAAGDRVAREIRPKHVIYREQTTGIRWLLAHPEGLVKVDSVLGWRYRAGYRDSVTAINCQGLRSSTEYSPTPAAGVLRVAAFGDSFVFSNEVDNGSTWANLVEQLFPALEVLNYGVGGYGVDQAYLRYLGEGEDLAPHVVLIGFVRDDITRVVNVYRRFRSSEEIPLVKPRFTIDRAGVLSLVPSPIRTPDQYEPILEDPSRIIQWGRHDTWFEPAVYRNPLYDHSVLVRILTQAWTHSWRRIGPDRLIRGGALNPESEAFRIQVALFRHFADSVRSRGARPIILLFPGRGELQEMIQGTPSVLEPLRQSLKAHDLEFLDVLEAFRNRGMAQMRSWFMPGGHYSPTGNRVVAEWLGHRLQELRTPASNKIVSATESTIPTVDREWGPRYRLRAGDSADGSCHGIGHPERGA